MNEIVGNAVDIPGDAYRIDKTENQHHPKRHARKKIKHPEKVNAMQNGGGNRERVPARMRKDLGMSRGALDSREFVRRQWHGGQKTILVYSTRPVQNIEAGTA